MSDIKIGLSPAQMKDIIMEQAESIQSLTADNARQSKEITLLREALSFLYREASVTYRYTKSNGLGGYTPLLPDALDMAQFTLLPKQEVSDGH